MKKYFTWAHFSSSDSLYLRKLSDLKLNISESITLRSLLDLAIPLERFLEISVKDDLVLRVKTNDSLEIERKVFPLYFVLDHLRSAFNVGSLFRVADCMGVKHIFLIGYTPTPDDKGVRKTAMGTDQWVSWSHHHHFSDVFSILQERSCSIFALETAEASTSLYDFKANEPLALIVGNERFGLTERVLSQVDGVLSIPMMGVKNSLNVATAMSMVTSEVIRQWTH